MVAVRLGRNQSPRRGSPCSSPRGGLSSESVADLIRKKRDRPARGSSSPRREKSKARTDRSPRSSPPPRLMGPPPPVVTSPPPQLSGEKTNRGVTPRQEDAESRDAPLK
ncbi:unnamed protein product [Arabidopsis thaliana]|uniref:Uncharacterized protein n=1 Tax=Arabidopsis thaliana TaxID=3702 RepID=A0A5S9Y8L7_ARATH|nr:unnamed protein product [Arabidopsis thaliana]